MMFSLIVPFYGSDIDVLKENLGHLLSSELLLECIVIDDNETPLAGLLLLKDEFPKLKIMVNHKNIGPSLSRNVGAGVARGEYLFFCDADVVVTKESFERAASKIEKSRLDLLQGHYSDLLRLKDGPSTYKHFWQQINISEIKEGKTSIVGTSLFIIKKSLFYKSGGFLKLLDNRASVEDRIFGMGLKKEGKDNYFCPFFIGEHVHRLGLSDLIGQTFWRSVDEVYYMKELSANFSYNSPKKLICLFLFVLGGLGLLLNPPVGMALIFSSLILELAFLKQQSGRINVNWTWISVVYNVSIICGALIGLFRLVRRKKTSP